MSFAIRTLRTPAFNFAAQAVRHKQNPSKLARIGQHYLTAHHSLASKPLAPNRTTALTILPSPSLSLSLHATALYGATSTSLIIQDPFKGEVFTSFTQNLSLEQSASFKTKLQNLPKADSFIAALTEAMDNFSPEHPVFENPLYPYYAFLGVCQGKINQDDFCSLMLYWNASQTCPLFHLPIFENGKVPKNVRSIIEQTFISSARASVFFPPFHLITNEEKDAFFQQLSTLPKFQQQLLLMPEVKYRDTDGQPVHTIMDAICNYIGFNVFGRTTAPDGTKMSIIPTFGMMKAFLEVKFGKDATTMIPVFGLSSSDQIRSKLPLARDFAIPFPEFPLPKEADSVAAPDRTFDYHEWYHWSVLSATPLADRSRLLTFLKLFEKYLTPFDSSDVNPHFSDATIDMENPAYLNIYLERTSPMFWKVLYLAVYKACLIHLQATNQEGKLAEKALRDLFMHEPVFQMILTSLIQNRAVFKTKYKIDIKELFQIKAPVLLYEAAKTALMNLLPNDQASLESISDNSQDSLFVLGAKLKLAEQVRS